MQGKPIAGLIEKIAKECEEANADKWTITKIVKQLSQEEEQDIKALRKKALEILQQLDPKAASIYASFQSMQVRVSSQHIKSFDRGNIIRSLLRETTVPRGVAEKIGHEVEEKIKDLEIESISTPLIRELVNVKLLEYGHENIRDQYTRLGLPVFEVKKAIEKMPYSNRAMLTEYNLLRVIPKKLGRMHLSGEIFIAEVHDFSTKPVAAVIVPEIRENARETVFALLEKANAYSGFFSWRPNIAFLNAAIAINTGKNSARDASFIFARAAKSVFLSGKAVPAFNTISLFEPYALGGKPAQRESMASAANAMMGSFPMERPAFENAVAIDTKYKLKLLRKEKPGLVVNCKNSESGVANGVATESRGLCSFTGLNMNFIALGNRGNETAFFDEIGKKIKAIAQLDQLKRKELSERAYLGKQGISVDGMQSALALDSLFDSSRKAIQSEKEKDAILFSEKVMSFVRKRLPESFVITELRNANALHRFSMQNKRAFNAGNRYSSEERYLRKSPAVRKGYCFEARAKSLKEMNELLDLGVKLVRLEEGKETEPD